MELLSKNRKLQSGLIAITVSVIVSFIGFYLETSLTKLVVDAQAGIVVMFAFIKSSLLFIFLAISLYHYFMSRAERYHMGTNKFFIFSAILLVFSGYSMSNSVAIKSALVDAANPSTAQERLRELVGYESGFGYEVDNRIARNPSTPNDVLESLYAIPGQIGTDMSLAVNPSTPNHILIALSQREDEY